MAGGLWEAARLSRTVPHVGPKRQKRNHIHQLAALGYTIALTRAHDPPKLIVIILRIRRTQRTIVAR